VLYVTYNASFILLSKTWLKPFVPDSFFIDCNRYSMLCHDRTAGVGGDVCAIVSTKFNIFQIETDPNLELVALDLIFCDTKLRFNTVYRKPEYTGCANKKQSPRKNAVFQSW